MLFYPPWNTIQDTILDKHCYKFCIIIFLFLSVIRNKFKRENMLVSLAVSFSNIPVQFHNQREIDKATLQSNENLLYV